MPARARALDDHEERLGGRELPSQPVKGPAAAPGPPAAEGTAGETGGLSGWASRHVSDYLTRNRPVTVQTGASVKPGPRRPLLFAGWGESPAQWPGPAAAPAGGRAGQKYANKLRKSLRRLRYHYAIQLRNLKLEYDNTIPQKVITQIKQIPISFTQKFWSLRNGQLADAAAAEAPAGLRVSKLPMPRPGPGRRTGRAATRWGR